MKTSNIFTNTIFLLKCSIPQFGVECIRWLQHAVQQNKVNRDTQITPQRIISWTFKHRLITLLGECNLILCGQCNSEKHFLSTSEHKSQNFHVIKKIASRGKNETRISSEHEAILCVVHRWHSLESMYNRHQTLYVVKGTFFICSHL